MMEKGFFEYFLIILKIEIVKFSFNRTTYMQKAMNLQTYKQITHQNTIYISKVIENALMDNDEDFDIKD